MLIKVIYLDEAGIPLPDADNDTKPEILAKVGETKFYIQIIVERIPNLKESYVSVYTKLEEAVIG